MGSTSLGAYQRLPTVSFFLNWNQNRQVHMNAPVSAPAQNLPPEHSQAASLGAEASIRTPIKVEMLDGVYADADFRRVEIVCSTLSGDFANRDFDGARLCLCELAGIALT
jgi:hypothetical protein